MPYTHERGKSKIVAAPSAAESLTISEQNLGSAPGSQPYPTFPNTMIIYTIAQANGNTVLNPSILVVSFGESVGFARYRISHAAMIQEGMRI